mgnify:CR=1 FL=1
METRGWQLADLSPIARNAVRLYFRCQMFNEIALPESGGVLDQNELVVSMLETVHGFVMEFRNREMDKSIRVGNKPAQSFPGVNSRDTENISIGKNFNKRITR